MKNKYFKDQAHKKMVFKIINKLENKLNKKEKKY